MFARRERDMLWAEGLMRIIATAKAVVLINRTRAINNLGVFPDGSTKDTPAPPYRARRPWHRTLQRSVGTPASSAGRPELVRAAYPHRSAAPWFCEHGRGDESGERRMETLLTGYSQWIPRFERVGRSTVRSRRCTRCPIRRMDARNQTVSTTRWSRREVAGDHEHLGFGFNSR